MQAWLLKNITAIAIGLAIALLVSAGLLALTIAGSVANHYRLTAKVTEVQGKLDTATVANASWEQTNQRVASELQTCIGDRQAQEDATAKALADNETTRAKLAAERAARAKERSTIYATDEDCRTWATAPVCAAIDRGL